MTGVPYGLLRHQGPMLLTGARVVGHTLLNALAPASKPGVAPAPQRIAPVSRVIAAPPDDLVAQYVAWSGAASGHEGALPPHMVSQWSLPLVGELLLRMPYNLTRVINQGVGLRVNGPLPRNTSLLVSAAVEQIEEVSGRIKVVVAVTTGTAQQPSLVEARLHMSFLLPGPRPARRTQERPPEPQWTTAGIWHADLRDGLRFALLTGDFNPIHWCAPLARRSVFRGMVLHGFGSFVRSYEVLLQRGIAFSKIDVRFVKPVPLPCSTLAVQVAPADDAGWRAVRLAGAAGDIHLAGNLR
ncbi:hypothetical protein GJ697_22720 [Pseudoduganella sp. FT25W]|uniref:MaoC-like domain-containing protein n=1 Tax=Duganella alba TaxID=2666081 RepID=A0A6L5QP15_9BURK|nr:MaoC/PaaZ C-terminal domain-containing protein [Duganella alba]MRX10651.1 hypothetical protein [Duganella alba]MRX15730.1 hypothetical protein [Duganella alba]